MDLLKHINVRVSRFTNDLCAINDGSEFLTLFKNIYPGC